MLKWATSGKTSKIAKELQEPTEITAPPSVLDEHNNTVFCVSFAPAQPGQVNGDLASASYDGTTRVWDVTRCLTSSSKRVKHHLRGSLGGVWCCQYSPDLPALVTGCARGTVCIYDTSKKYNQIERRQQTHGSHAVFTTSISAGGLMATGGGDNNLKIWNMGSCFDVSSGELALQHQLEGHAGDVVSCSFGPTGGRAGLVVASGSEDRHIRIWDVERGDCLQTVIGHTAEVCCVQYSPDGSLLASASSDRVVRICDSRQRHRCIEVLEGHSCAVYSLAFRKSDGYSLFSTASQDGTVLLWDPRTWKCCRKIETHAGEVVCCGFSSSGNMLATGSADMCVHLHRLREAYGPTEGEYIAVEGKKSDITALRTSSSRSAPTGIMCPTVMEVGSSTGAPRASIEVGVSMRAADRAPSTGHGGTRSKLGHVGEGNRGSGYDGEEALLRRRLERFYMIYRPEKFENASSLARAYMRRGGGPKEATALNRDLLKAYGADLSVLGPETPTSNADEEEDGSGLVRGEWSAPRPLPLSLVAHDAETRGSVTSGACETQESVTSGAGTVSKVFPAVAVFGASWSQSTGSSVEPHTPYTPTPSDARGGMRGGGGGGQALTYEVQGDGDSNADGSIVRGVQALSVIHSPDQSRLSVIHSPDQSRLSVIHSPDQSRLGEDEHSEEHGEWIPAVAAPQNLAPQLAAEDSTSYPMYGMVPSVLPEAVQPSSSLPEAVPDGPPQVPPRNRAPVSL